MTGPASYNFIVVEGDTFSATITLRDKETQNPIDLTGATPKMQVKTAYNAASSSLDLTVGAGITVTNAAGGIITLSKTVNLSAADYVYDLQVTFSGPIVRTYLRGRFKVLEGVTT